MPRRLLLFALLTSSLACTSKEDSGSSETELDFPDDFRWGVATSAFQTEGGITDDWTAWIDEGGAPEYGDGVDSWNRWEEDLDLAVGLGLDTYRISLEWSRLEPQDGTWDLTAFAHYHRVIEGIRARGMDPVLTLHHYTNPIWFAEGGSWTRDDAVSQFEDLAARVAQELGDVIDVYNPMNEPMLYAAGCKLAAIYPGGAFNDGAAFEHMYRNLLFAHAAAATALREHDLVDADGDGATTSIWAVTAAWPAWPADPESEDDIAAASRYHQAYNHAFPGALVSGEFDANLDGDTDDPGEGYHAELASTLDVIGVNYYSRTFVVALEASALGGLPCMPGMGCGSPGPVAGDNGNEVYPEGLYDALVDFTRWGLPLWVTENGVADEDDDLRPSFIVTHLAEIARAIQDGAPVGGYLHWSLMDNYEWRAGYDLDFGLYTVDAETNDRAPHPNSVEVYREIVTTNRVSSALVETWPLPAAH